MAVIERLQTVPPILEGFDVISIKEGTDLVIAVADTEDKLLRLQSQAEEMRHLRGISVDSVNFKDLTIFIVGDQFIVRTEKSMSPASQAIYLAKSKFLSPAVWIQGLEKEGDQTSMHYHTVYTEQYFRLWGNASLQLNDQFHDLDGHLIVDPWNVHRVRGGKEGSIVAIVTTGSENCFDMSDHHYVSSYEDFTKNHLPPKP